MSDMDRYMRQAWVVDGVAYLTEREARAAVERCQLVERLTEEMEAVPLIRDGDVAAAELAGQLAARADSLAEILTGLDREQLRLCARAPASVLRWAARLRPGRQAPRGHRRVVVVHTDSGLLAVWCRGEGDEWYREDTGPEAAREWVYFSADWWLPAEPCEQEGA